MHRTVLTATAISLLAGAAHAQTVWEPIAEGYAGLALSHDGEAMAGNWIYGQTYETFRWTRLGGIEHLGRDTAAFGTGGGLPCISADGTKVSDTITSDDGNNITVGIWEEGVGWTDCMPPPPADGGIIDLKYGSAWGISADGSTVSGLYWRPGQPGGNAHVFGWTAAGGAVGIAAHEANNSRGNAVNADGTVFVGWQAADTGNWQPHALRNGVEYMLSDSIVGCQGWDVTPDGGVVVGDMDDGNTFNPSRRAALWTWNGAGYDHQDLGALPGTPVGPTGHVFANGVSDDGTIVVGTNRFFSNGPFSGVNRLPVDAANGNTRPGRILRRPRRAAARLLPARRDQRHLRRRQHDRRSDPGCRHRRARHILIHLPVACSGADITTQGAGEGVTTYGLPDGVIWGADINYYVNGWLTGDLITADVTTTGAGAGDAGYGVPDGEVTGADIQYYVNLWIAGCP